MDDANLIAYLKSLAVKRRRTPRMREIGQHFGVSECVVQKRVRKLSKEGYFEIERTPGGGWLSISFEGGIRTRPREKPLKPSALLQAYGGTKIAAMKPAEREAAIAKLFAPYGERPFARVL